jgi:(p)ppGpp synthase/HD superfamily hydrolase
MQAAEPESAEPPAGRAPDAQSDTVLLLARAFRFAAAQHAAQRRKGAAAEPYVNHLAEVADLVARATGGADPNLVAAALLHDTVEDTGTTRAELEALFGADVAALVAEATDDKSLPKAERKRLQVVHAPSRSPRAKLLKIADKASNLRALAASPPAAWSVERRQAYVAWARSVVAGLRGGNPWLERRFDEAAAAADAANAVPQP